MEAAALSGSSGVQLEQASEIPRGLKRPPDWQDPSPQCQIQHVGLGSEIRIGNKFPDDSQAAGPGTPL